MFRNALFALLAMSGFVLPARAQTFALLVEFDGSAGTSPFYGPLLQASNGGLYGTAQFSANGWGTVFEITPAGQLRTLYNFCPQIYPCPEGSQPWAGLDLAVDGNLYGTTAYGGTNCISNGYQGCGTIFKITQAGQLTTLYSFCAQADCSDGAYPSAAIIQGIDGSFYGTTSIGGVTNTACQGGCGTVFRVSPGGVVNTIHDFCTEYACADGFNPTSRLVQGTDGNFYGTAEGGTNFQAGIAFKMTAAGTLTPIYNFCAVGYPLCTDGAEPSGNLVQGTDGNFYGETSYGGVTMEGGTVFKLTPNGTLTTLHRFCAQANCADGQSPYGGLVQATDGNLYGVTRYGGAGCNQRFPVGCGTIFQIALNGSFSVLHMFDGSDGEQPLSALIQDSNGLLYGTTYFGGEGPCSDGNGDFGCGTVFSMNMGLAPFVTFVRNVGYVSQTGPILGQGFTGTTSVSLNGTPIPFTIKSDTLITATIPAGGTTGPITVTTPTGTLTSNVPFRVLPQLLSFTPTSGPVGTQVTITGVSLTQTTGVGFGDYTPAPFTVNSDTQVTATVPTGAQTGPVGIQTQGGIAISTQVFTVTP